MPKLNTNRGNVVNRYDIIGNILYKMWKEDELEIIGSGHTRDTYVFGKYALKVGSESANECEYDAYQRYVNDGISDMFTTVYAIDKNRHWILVERVDPCFGDNESCEEITFNPVICGNNGDDLMDEYDIPVELVDLMPDCCLFNIGRRFSSGEYVILDFA